MDITKEIVGIGQGIATILAIFLGGFWTYLVFVRTRQKFPRANIRHDIKHYSVGSGKMLLHVDVIITNVGDVLMSIVTGQVRVQQILPIPDEIQIQMDEGANLVKDGETEVNWPLPDENCDRVKKWMPGAFEIEPNESDQVNYDFIIGADITAIEVYSYFANIEKRKKEIGWECTTVYDMHSTRSSTLTGMNGGPNEK